MRLLHGCVESVIVGVFYIKIKFFYFFKINFEMNILKWFKRLKKLIFLKIRAKLARVSESSSNKPIR